MELPKQDTINCYKQLIRAISEFTGPEAYIVKSINKLVSAETKDEPTQLRHKKDVGDLLFDIYSKKI